MSNRQNEKSNASLPPFPTHHKAIGIHRERSPKRWIVAIPLQQKSGFQKWNKEDVLVFVLAFFCVGIVFPKCPEAKLSFTY